VRNLRDARRYLSSVSIHLSLHAGQSAFEVNIIDFLALEALRVFEPDFHAALFGERDLLLQAGRFRNDRRDDEHRVRAEALVGRVADGRRDIVRAALKELFPRLGWAFGGSYYADGEWDVEWIQEKRVCSPRFFPRYFELQTPEGELSESDFGDFIALSGDAGRLNMAIEEIRGRGLVESLAARLNESVGRLPVENAAVLLPAMYCVAQSLVSSCAADPFNSPWVSAWRAISWYVRRLPEADRTPIMLSALRRTGALSVAVILIGLNSPENRDERSRLEPAIDAAGVKELQVEWLKQLRTLATEGTLQDQPDLGSLLICWRDYTGSPDEPRAWVSEVTSSDAGLANVAAKLMSSGTTQSIEDRVASRFDTFDRAVIDTFFVMEEVRRRVYSMDRSRLSPEMAHAVDVLKRHLDAWSGDGEEHMNDLPSQAPASGLAG